MYTRTLFLVGLALLLIALVGSVLRFTRSYPRGTLSSSVGGEVLLPPILAFEVSAPRELSAEDESAEVNGFLQLRSDIDASALAIQVLVKPDSETRWQPSGFGPECAATIRSRYWTIEPGCVWFDPEYDTFTVVAALVDVDHVVDLPGSIEPYYIDATGFADLKSTVLPYVYRQDVSSISHPFQVTRITTRTVVIQPTTERTPPPLPTEAIEAEWPAKMEKGHADSIRVSLVRVAGQTLAPTVEVVGHTAVAVPLSPVGTARVPSVGEPSVPIEQAFGPEYEAFAIAYLAGAAFDIEALGANYQPLDQTRINWDWNIVPKTGGSQVVNVKIEVQWKLKGSNGETTQVVQREIWRERFDIYVEDPFIKRGYLDFGVVLAGILGSVLCYKTAKEIFPKREKDEDGGKTHQSE